MPLMHKPRPHHAALAGALALALLAGGAPVGTAGAEERDDPVAAPAAAGEVTLELTADAARRAAVQYLRDGRLDAARRVSLAILAQDPDDLTALLVMAAAGAKTGHEKLAATAGRRAFRLATVPEQRFESAYLTAAALDRGGKSMQSQLWLRRAAEAAPNEEFKDLATRSFRNARQSAPLRLRFDLGLTASDNVNDGSVHDVMWIIGLPFEVANALPGTVAQVGVTADYRVHQSATSQTVLRLGLVHRDVSLRREVLRRDPTARGSDYDQSGAQIGVTHWTRPFGDMPLTLRFGGSVGQTWQGGQALSRDAELRIGADWAATDRTVLSAQWAGTRRDHLTNARRDADIASIDLSVVHQKGPAAGQISLALSFADIHSTAMDLQHQKTGITLGWQPGWQPAGIKTDLSLTLEHKDYTRLIGLDPEIGVSAGANVTLTRIDYMGFAPNLSIRAERNRSDFVPRDRRGLSFGLGIVSTF